MAHGGLNGTDAIQAALAPEEAAASGASFGLDLRLRALKPPALHQGNGFIDFGPAGFIILLSRTRLAATGELNLNGATLKVTGIAWFDHQWGDFVSVGAGGWDWFAINLDDGTDITISIVLDEHGEPILEYGTLVRPSGEVVALQTSNDFGVVDDGLVWQSPTTGVSYNGVWIVSLSGAGLIPTLPSVDGQQALLVQPTVADQELDTRATTGVAYWEGSEIVTAAPLEISGVEGRRVGKAYVEITRYGTPRS